MVDAAELVERGEQSLAVWEPLVLAALKERYSNEGTAHKAVADAGRLFRYLDARGARGWCDVTADLVVDWCWTARRRKDSEPYRRPTKSTARNHQWAARTALKKARSLGALIDPAELLGVSIARRTESAFTKLLVEEEAELVRVYADAGLVASRRSLIVAFAFAGGTNSEIAAVRMCDVDPEAGTVAFSGEGARICPLDAWGVTTVRRYLRNHPPVAADELLCVTPGDYLTSAAHRVTVRLGQVVRDAGLKGRPGLSARSIRLTTARKILDSDGIEAAARFLGSPSLDTTADALGHQWRHADV